MIEIRKAEKKDSKAISEYLLLAMEEIVYEFIDEKNHEKAMAFMDWCVYEEDTQYSYQNAWVAVNDTEIVGAVVLYDGSELLKLRNKVAEYLKNITLKPFNPEDETQSGEFYIDSFGVSLKHRGKGIGSKLLQFLIDEFVLNRKQTLGLLVDKDNPNAKRLYERLGFKVVGEKTLVGKEMEHLQVKPKEYDY